MDEPGSVPTDAWVAIVCIDDQLISWSATIGSLVLACDRVVVAVVGSHTDEVIAAFGHHDNVEVVSATLADAMAGNVDRARALVVVYDLCVVTPDAFDRAREMLERDIRIATISFFSNDADYLSFPERNTPNLLMPAGFDEVRINRLLRDDPLVPGPVPLPAPAGAVVVVSTSALRAIGLPAATAPTAEYALLDFALNAVRRGLRNVLDAGTYILRVPNHQNRTSALHDPELRRRLTRNHSFFPALYDYERESQHAPLASAIAIGRSALLGLSVLVDATVLGPFEMGTQVSLLRLITAFCERDDIREVVTAVRPGVLPDYAKSALDNPKVRLVLADGAHFQDVGRVEILHVPYQPAEPFPWGHWRSIADRVVVTVLDLIAYDNGSYFPTPEHWLEYRDKMRRGIEAADGVAAISADSAQAIETNRIPIPPDRVRVIEYGADHSPGADTRARIPDEVVRRGLVAADFIFVLGASYSHKNRDAAIRAWRELRGRGYPQKLIMAGVVVPYGSTRNEESRLRSIGSAADGDGLVILSDVTAGERHWLMSHARLVLYPTSAEGFGLVPFEAATCDTPCLFVRFGPLAELLGGITVSAADWGPVALADAMAQLLDDPMIARAQIEFVRDAGKKLTWTKTAEQFVAFYRELLARPALGR